MQNFSDNTKVQANDQKNNERTIIDLGGDKVIIPSAGNINRVVLMGPPLFATYMSTVKDPSKLVGVNPNSFKEANQKLLDLIFPNWKKVNTTFLTGNEPNIEEVLKMKPDIIFVYGQGHKKALGKINIPVVEFSSKQEDESWLIDIDRLFREIFDLKTDGFIAKEWQTANNKVEDILKQSRELSNQKALIIGVNTGDDISIRGPGSFGHVVLKKSGLVDVSEELNAMVVGVTMEQVYTWNPEIIYLFKGIAAEKYLSNSIKNQDWSKVKAFETGKIYDVPKGLMHWGSPNPDSPLMLQWLLTKNFPGQFSKEDFEMVMKEYYRNNYGIELTDELVTSILYPNKAK